MKIVGVYSFNDGAEAVKNNLQPNYRKWDKSSLVLMWIR